MQGKKFISPGAWFSMNYPSDWNEFEDGEGSFLFYNPDVWTGNFRISAFKGNATYGRDAVRQELKENESASLVKVGALQRRLSPLWRFARRVRNIRRNLFLSVSPRFIRLMKATSGWYLP